jgi:Ca-activated chloride channel homolog
MFRFANIEFLKFLYAIPLFIVLYIVLRWIRKKNIAKFGHLSVVSQLMPEVSAWRFFIKYFLIVLAYAAMVFAIARPQFGSRLKEVTREGVELFIALDVSNSMLAQDIKPSRLERSLRAISRLIDNLSGDKIGLIVFAGDAYMQLPLTTDYNAAKLFLTSVNTEVVPRQGTAIGSAINLAMKSFNFQNEVEKAIVVITDGENHEDDPLQAAKDANAKGVRVFAIGMGTKEGAPIPMHGIVGQNIFRKDQQGSIIVSRLDEDILRNMVNAGDGIFVRATTADAGLDRIFKEINKMDKKEIDAKVYADYDDQFQYFVALAFFLLLLESVLLERKNKWLTKIKLFN